MKKVWQYAKPFWYNTEARQTSVSDTIRKPPFVKAQTALKNKISKIWRKRFLKWRMELLRPAMWHDHDINFARWLQPAMWHVALKSWQCIHQVAAPCNVTRSSGIMTLNSPGGNVAGCSGMTCHGIRPNVRHIGILHLVSILTISPQLTCHSAPVYEILSKSDHPLQKKIDVMSFFKMADLSDLGFYGSDNGFFEKPMCSCSGSATAIRFMSNKTKRSAVAERPRDAFFLSVVSFNIPTAQVFYY